MRYMASDLSCGHGSSEKTNLTAYLTRTRFIFPCTHNKAQTNLYAI